MLTSQQLLAQSIRIVNEAFVGMMTTVDAQGMPYARWMGTATLANGISRIYTLSGGQARKLAHLEKNPQVCWVFSSDQYADVVTLYGTARALRSPIVAQSVWDRLVDCARAYCMSALSDERNLEFVTIETLVRRVEFISPRQKIYQPQIVELPSDHSAA